LFLYELSCIELDGLELDLISLVWTELHLANWRPGTHFFVSIGFPVIFRRIWFATELSWIELNWFHLGRPALQPLGVSLGNHWGTNENKEGCARMSDRSVELNSNETNSMLLNSIEHNAHQIHIKPWENKWKQNNFCPGTNSQDATPLKWNEFNSIQANAKQCNPTPSKNIGK